MFLVQLKITRNIEATYFVIEVTVFPVQKFFNHVTRLHIQITNIN